MLVIDKVSKKIGAKIILDSISLKIARGHIALLLGSSGAGKSTLLRILNGLESYDSGTILLDDKPLHTDAAHKEHTVGMVFQHFNLFDHLTVLENITLALIKALEKNKEESNSIAYKLLEHYNLTDKAHQYPAQLSGGQKQRLALIRTLALHPKVICLDEPTSALDPVLTNQVAQTIISLAQANLMVAVSSHDISLVTQLPCTIYLMRDGRIVETAASDDFVSNQQKYPHLKAFIAGQLYSQPDY